MERARDHGREKRRSAGIGRDAGSPARHAFEGIGNQALQRMQGDFGGARLWQGGGADRMLGSIGALGAALGPDVLVSSNLDWRTRRSVIAHELTHVRQTGGRRPSGPARAIDSPHSRDERQANIAGAIGAPLGSANAGADPGTLRLFDRNALLSGSITDLWAQALTDTELVEAGLALRTQIASLAPDVPEHASAVANNGVIEREQIRRGLDAERRERASEALAKRPTGAPVTFAIDNTTRSAYVTVTGAGSSPAEIATYLYGSAELAGDIARANGFGADVTIPAGTTLHLLATKRSATAEQALEAGLSTGAIVRTDGVPASLADDGMVYMFPGPAGQLTLNATQANSMLTALRERTVRLLAIHIDALRYTLRLRNAHEDDSLVMRNIVELWGDVELPPQEDFTFWIKAGEDTTAQLNALAFDPDPRVTARALGLLQQRGGAVADADTRRSNDMSAYFRGFISGGETLVGQLEFVRNVSFGIVAGLAGAVVAPAAFAALTAAGVTGGTATVLSLGAAAGTGGLLRGTAEVVAPGAQADRSVGDRFGSGFYSGSIAGLGGGAGAFLTPAVSGAVTSQLVGQTSRSFAQSTAGQFIVQSSTGAIIGVPTGMAGTALDTLPDYARGRISGDQYASGIGWGGVTGGVFGAASPLLPVKGLYRSGTAGLRGTPVTPAWMMAGPYSPLAPVRGMTPEFHQLSENALPAFSDDPAVAGYVWSRVRSGGTDQWVPMRTYGPQAEFELAWYGDNTVPAATTNFNFLYGPAGNANALRLVGGRQILAPQGAGYAGMAADTPVMGMPRSTRHDFPMTPADMDVTMPDGTTQRMIRGHNVDHSSTTPRTATIPDSNMDVRNFTPEPLGWGGGPRTAPANLRGFGGREAVTARMRTATGGTEVRQVNVYSETPLVSAGGKPVPDHIYFIEVGPTGNAVRAWRIPFSDPTAFNGLPMSRAATIDANFTANVANLPQVVLFEGPAIPAWVLGMAGIGRAEPAPAR